MFIDFRERKGERHTHTHQCEAETWMGCLPRHAPQPGIEPATVWVYGRTLQPTEPAARASHSIPLTLLDTDKYP